METIELPGTITVRDPEPVIAHMASYPGVGGSEVLCVTLLGNLEGARPE
ncbi:hypothetical protein AB0I77_08780 [Streptomyces sp. NPDC050619]